MTSPPLLPQIALLINAALWGISWLPYKLMEAEGLSILLATGLAYGLLTAGLASLRPAALMSLASSALWPMAIAYGLTNTFFNWALATGEVVRVVLLFFLMPLWSALFARLLLGIRLGPAGMARLALAVGGAVAVLGLPALLAGGSLLGEGGLGLADLLALLGGMSFGLGNVLLRGLSSAPAENRLMAMFTGSALAPFALMGLLILLQPLIGLSLPPSLGLKTALEAFSSPTVWLVLPLLVGGLALANVCLQYGASRLQPQLASILMLFEILVAVVSSALLTGRAVQLSEWIGGLLIVSAAAWAGLDQGARDHG